MQFNREVDHKLFESAQGLDLIREAKMDGVVLCFPGSM
jgi:hypothetical protein